MAYHNTDATHDGGRSGTTPSQLTLLLGALRRAKGFCLYFVQCSQPYHKKRAVDVIRSTLDKPIVEVEFQPLSPRTIDFQIEIAVENTSPDTVIFLHGIEKLFTDISSDESFKRRQEINIRRNFYARLERPLVLWAPEFALPLFAQGVPDFYDWYSGSYILEPPVQQIVLSRENRFDFQLNDTDHVAEKIAVQTYKRPYTQSDIRLFNEWVDLYHRKLKNPGDARQALLDLGRDIYLWLNAAGGMMKIIQSSAPPPLIMEFSVTENPTPDQLLFLEVPWELLADESGHLAANPRVQFCPIRRIGAIKTHRKTSEFQLRTVFMAAAPLGGDAFVDYEAEEAAVIETARDVGMDLTMEESGSLPFLAECLEREWPVDILHISCGGRREPEPALLLETEVGDPSTAGQKEFIEALGAFQARLLFLTANSAPGSAQFPYSFSTSIVQSGFPAALAWDAPLSNKGSFRFAGSFYAHLATRRSIETAAALARYGLLNPPESTAFQPYPEWHLARLYFGPHGGGVVSTGQKLPRREAPEATKTFLDFTERHTPVAGKHEFVGRRRQIRKIVKAFRENKHAGVLIHGFGRIDKSSLAARIMDRLVDLKPVVVLGRYDAFAILDKLYAAVETPETLNAISRFRKNPESFSAIFQQLLDGPCRETTKDPNGKNRRQAILLIIDDFERALDEPAGKTGPHRLKSELSSAIRSVIQAFSRANTESRLLFTSRYRFTLPYKDRDLVDDLLLLHPPPMDEHVYAP